jgi:hypothetical protein
LLDYLDLLVGEAVEVVHQPVYLPVGGVYLMLDDGFLALELHLCQLLVVRKHSLH